MAAGDDHDQQSHDAQRQPDAVVVVGEHHVVAHHAPDHQRQAKRQGNSSLPAETPHRAAGAELLLLTSLLLIIHHLRAITCSIDGRYQLLRVSVAQHQRTAFAEIDTRLAHACDLLQRFFHPTHAAGAGHALNQQHMGGECCFCRTGSGLRCQRLRRRL